MTEHRINPLQWLSTKFASINHSHNEYLTSHQDISGKEDKSNKLTSLNGLTYATDNLYPSALVVKNYLDTKEDTSNKVTSISSSSTDDEYPSALCVYDAIDNETSRISNIEDTINDLGVMAFRDTLDEVAGSSDIINILEQDGYSLFSGDYDDLDNKPTIPTQTSQLTNNSGFITSSSLSNYLQQSDVKDNLTSTDTNKPLSANQGTQLKALIDSKEDNIEIFTGSVVRVNSTSAYLKAYTTSSIIEGKIILYKVPNISSIEQTTNVALDYYMNNQTSQFYRRYIYKNGVQLTFGEIESNSWILLAYDGALINGQWNLISSSSYAEANHTHSNYLTSHQDVSDKEDKSNKVTSLSSSSTDAQYPSAKLVYDQLNNKAPTSHASSSTTYGVATASNYGHTKVINNLTTSNNNNGESLSAYQGKVLNDSKVDKNDFNVDYVYSFVYNTSIEKYAYQGQSGAVGIGVSAIDENDNSLLNENGVAIIDLVFQNTNINYGSIQLVLAEADGVRYTNSSDLLNTQTIATISDTNEHHITVVVSSDTHIVEQGYDYYDLKVSKISYDGSNITVSSGKTNMERVGVYLVFNGAIGGNIEYMNVIKRTPIVNQIIDIIYPIGSTYISVNSVNPSFLFGGEWEQIQDRFLLASGSTYSAGTTGGSATVTLTAGQSGVPAHSHKYNDYNTTYTLKTTNRKPGTSTAVAYGTSLTAGGGATERTSSNNTAANASQAHENMPPYLTVYMWKRTA